MAEMTNSMQLRRRHGGGQPDAPVSRVFLRKFAENADLFPKPREDFQRQQTKLGSAVSWLGFIIISCFILSEFIAYAIGWDAYHSELSVDLEVNRKVPVHFDITFPAIQCTHLNLDAMDVAGTEAQEMLITLHKSPVNTSGQIHSIKGKYNYAAIKKDVHGRPATIIPYCDRCPDLPGPTTTPVPSPFRVQRMQLGSMECCNTCQSVMDTYDQHGVPRPAEELVEQCINEVSYSQPGCNIVGVLELKKVHCNFHFAPGKPMRTPTGPAAPTPPAINNRRQQQQQPNSNDHRAPHHHHHHEHPNGASQQKVDHLQQPSKHVHAFADIYELLSYNITHSINHFSIGDERIPRFSKRANKQGGAAAEAKEYYPLNGMRYTTPREKLAQMNYYIQVVPTVYQNGAKPSSLKERQQEVPGPGSSFEYSATYQHVEFPRLTGTARMRTSVFFVFEFYAMELTQVFERQPFYRFLIRLCPIVGGVFVMMGLVDTAVGSFFGRKCLS